MLKSLTAVATTVLLCGCASTLTAFTHRPVVEDNVKDKLSTVSLSADRRTVIVVTNGTGDGKFCAEPPPDTATGLKTELDAKVKAKKATLEAELGITDKSETTVVVLAERTAALDAFRTGVYSLCQFNLNGMLTNADVKELFIKLIDSFATNHAVK